MASQDTHTFRLPIDIPAPVTAANFAVRVDVNEIAYLHCDWERDAVFHQFNLNELLLQRQDIPLATIEEETEDEDDLSPVTPCSNPEFLSLSSAEIICPICMDTYDDPRTLSCGHSICNNCVEHMKATDAIETLEKARQLSLSNLRCGRCRTQCDECDMWICLKCCQERAVLETSFPTKTEELPDGADEKDDAATALTKRYSFCASCILKHHSNHRVDELSTFRLHSFVERDVMLESITLQCSDCDKST
ncbi:unnamed protein product [Anisakis simplex]|uniref:RING-type domain-containing protein n=1 Tax=Anisakis simplex TaxID=6269 RepID=A0A0M3KFJ6_ANISI|nr:unnamed protein product [Anisakis simplex]